MIPQQQGYTQLLQGAAAEARVRELGLEMDWLIQAALKSEMIRQSTSVFEPRSAAGTKAWFAMFGEFAQLVAPHGWRKEETLGLPRVVNVESGVAIAVVTGDARTGLSGQAPKSKAQRGKQSKLYIKTNHLQTRLPFGDLKFTPTPMPEEQLTWWLLIHSTGESVRAELSFPTGLDEYSRISTWTTRILIPVPKDGILKSRPDTEEEPPVDVKVVVRKR